MKSPAKAAADLASSEFGDEGRSELRISLVPIELEVDACCELKWLDSRIREIELIALADGTHCLRPPVGQTFKTVTSTGVAALALQPGERTGTISLSVQSGRRYKLLFN